MVNHLFVLSFLTNDILGVASNLEKKSRENARKMSSLVGMAGRKEIERGRKLIIICIHR